MVKTCLYLFACLFLASCANKTLIRDSEYQPVYSTLQKNYPDEALLVFPRKEENGFITTFEKAWIKFWSGEKFSATDVKKVQVLSDQIEQRKFVSISYEASVFLVGESEDGYIPSEHEIISLHLFLAMLYLDQNAIDPAHVELKRAVEYLANNPQGKETTFDDAAIRIWLASLWEAIGDRNASNVDLRKAMELSGNKSIEQLIQLNKRKINLHMSGLGPRINWSNSGQRFFFEYKLNAEASAENNFIFSTRKWYDWHQSRNTKIRDRLLSSHYMANSLGHKTSRVSQKTAGLAFAGVMYTAAAAVFVGGLYLAAQYGGVDPESIVYLAAGIAGWIVTKAEDLRLGVDKKIEESKVNEAENLKVYRMIRFLPSQIQYIDENLATAPKSKTYKGFRKLLGTGDNQVEFIWNPE
ncbi:MAG: hypothetical protein V4654_07045 [Bdellovibrionota bacterium]